MNYTKQTPNAERPTPNVQFRTVLLLVLLIVIVLEVYA
jgi:hypothetical protein